MSDRRRRWPAVVEENWVVFLLLEAGPASLSCLCEFPNVSKLLFKGVPSLRKGPLNRTFGKGLREGPSKRAFGKGLLREPLERTFGKGLWREPLERTFEEDLWRGPLERTSRGRATSKKSIFISLLPHRLVSCPIGPYFIVHCVRIIILINYGNY